MRKALCSAVLALAVPLHAGAAQAWQQTVHREMVDLAYHIMRAAQYEKQGGEIRSFSYQPDHRRLITRPSSLDEAEWTKFIDDMVRAVPRLNAIESSLPHRPECNISELSTASGALLRDLRFSPDDFYSAPENWPSDPHSDAEGFITSKTDACPVRLSNCVAPKCVDGELGARGSTKEPYRAGGVYNNLPASQLYAGTVLGYWSQFADWEFGDNRIDNFKLFDETNFMLYWGNMGGVGLAKDAARTVWVTAAGIILLPFACVISLFGGGDCGDAFDVADDINPTQLLDALPLDELSPTAPYPPQADLIGVWHHVKVNPFLDAPWVPRTDDDPGMWMAQGGPFGVPDATGLAANTAAELGGLTLDYRNSDGVRYMIRDADDGQQNSLNRSRVDWIRTTVPNTIFNPLDNLGYWGWRKFRFSIGRAPEARWLEWPLHAIGDASEPHHTIGSGTWGHVALESHADKHWERFRAHDFVPCPRDFAPCQERALADDFEYGRSLQIIEKAFAWRKKILEWRTQHAFEDPNDVPIRKLVTAVANDTWSDSSGDYWPFVPEPLIADESDYDDNEDAEQERFKEGTAATLAFLMSAAEIVPESRVRAAIALSVKIVNLDSPSSELPNFQVTARPSSTSAPWEARVRLLALPQYAGSASTHPLSVRWSVTRPSRGSFPSRVTETLPHETRGRENEQPILIDGMLFVPTGTTNAELCAEPMIQTVRVTVSDTEGRIAFDEVDVTIVGNDCTGPD